jgi:neurofibromin 1
LSKVSSKPPNTLPEHDNWNEISTLIHLALVVGSQSTVFEHSYLYVPEIIHLVSLIAGEGHSSVRKSVYGMIINLLQSLYISRPDDKTEPEIMRLIDDSTLPENLEVFGLRRETPTAEYSNVDSCGEKAFLDRQEKLAQLLLRIMTVTAGKTRKSSLMEFSTIYQTLSRFAKYLESSVDEFGCCNSVPAISRNSNTIICRSSNISCILGGR